MMAKLFSAIKTEKIEIIIARFGLAFPFIYAAIASLLHPAFWIDFFPTFLTNSISPEILIPLWAVIQITLGLWLVLGKDILIPSIIASIMLVGIFVFNLQLLDIIFRDVSILATAIVLVVHSYRNKNITKVS